MATQETEKVKHHSIDLITIDTLDMNDVQNLINAINENVFDSELRKELREKLDKWQRALLVNDTIRVTF